MGVGGGGHCNISQKCVAKSVGMDLVTITEEILNEKLYICCAVKIA